jgi:hypothetical protein
MVLRRIFGSRREEVTEGWRKLHNEECQDMCHKWGIRGMHIRYWWESQKEGNH